MINNTILLTNITNFSYNGNNLKYVCELDSISMMNNLDKTSKQAYLFLLIAFTLLTLYILVKKIQEVIKVRDALYIIYVFLLTSITIYTLTTFNITREMWNRIIEPILTILFFIAVGYIIYRERENIKEIIRRIKK